MPVNSYKWLFASLDKPSHSKARWGRPLCYHHMEESSEYQLPWGPSFTRLTVPELLLRHLSPQVTGT